MAGGGITYTTQESVGERETQQWSDWGGDGGNDFSSSQLFISSPWKTGACAWLQLQVVHLRQQPYNISFSQIIYVIAEQKNKISLMNGLRTDSLDLYSNQRKSVQTSLPLQQKGADVSSAFAL